MTGAIALGFMGSAAISTPVAAQTSCVNEPGLALFDQDSPKDGVLDVDDLNAVAALFPDNARLQELVAQASADPNFAIQYDGNCGGTTDPTPVPTEEPGDGTTDPTPVPTEEPGDGDDNGGETPGGQTPGGETPGGGDGVSELPDTGAGVAESSTSSWIMMSIGGALAAFGAFVFRTKKA
jgi:hypothetical protein